MDPVAQIYQHAMVMADENSLRTSLTSTLLEIADILEVEVTDTAAELLLENYDNSSFTNDAIFWYAKLLAGTKNPRYRKVLEEVAFRSMDINISKRMHEYIGEFDDGFPTQYKKGSIDLGSLREQYVNKAKSAWPTTNKTKIDAVNRRTTITEMIEILGYPDHVNVGRKFGMAGCRLYFYYRGKGRIEYLFERRGWRQKQVVSDPLAFELNLPYYNSPNQQNNKIDKKIAMAMLLDEGEFAAREILRWQFEHGNADQEFLDTAAELLLTDYQAQWKIRDVDTNAWICKVLAELGGPRYKEVLQSVADGTSSIKLTNFAETPINEARVIEGLSSELYIEGQIDLEKQKISYPSPYT